MIQKQDLRYFQEQRILVASIDIGTNSTHLLVAEINLDKKIQSATIINGIKGGKCITGNCIVSGGDKSGANIFHKFNSFDTRGSINSVLFKNENYKNVIVGVSSSKGSFINKPISLSEKGNLFWVSPGGINIGNGADFINISQLHLSTANSLHFSNGVFDVFSNRKYHLNNLPFFHDFFLDPILITICILFGWIGWRKWPYLNSIPNKKLSLFFLITALYIFYYEISWASTVEHIRNDLEIYEFLLSTGIFLHFWNNFKLFFKGRSNNLQY